MNCPHCHAANAEGAEVCFGCGRPLGPQGLRQGAVIAARYELLETLGSGGMGMVYRAHDRTLDETVALKVLRPEVAGQEEMARRFHSEIKLARKVRHKNVCAIHEYGEDGALRFITMEFIAGVDLRKVLTRDGALPPPRAWELAQQLAEGLEAIHTAGIVHRDLKTPNIMIDAQGVARLMDFGIAKHVDQQITTGAGIVAGTPEYMSPEQARGEAVDFRTDIYALGIVIFELFAGRVPFRGETPVATIFKHLQEAPPLQGPGAPPLPAALVPILARALAKEPKQRYPGVAELVAALRQARAGGLPARAEPVPGAAAAAGAAGPTWTCPRCRRHVPVRVNLCRCGETRPSPAPAAAGPPPAPAERGPSPLVLGAGLGALLVGGVALAMLVWNRPQPPGPRAIVLIDKTPEPVAAADPTPAPAPSESAATPLPTPSGTPAPSATPLPIVVARPEPSPTPTPADERAGSDIDRLREQGAQAFDESLAALARRAAEWRAAVQRCYGSTGLPAESPQVSLPGVGVSSCNVPKSELARVGQELADAVTHAEDEARRAWVPPGTQRALRQKHGLDQDTVERLRAEVRALER